MKRSVNAWPLHNQDNYEVDPCHLRFSKSQILFFLLRIINMIFLIQFAAAAAENWTGEGFARCYGDLNILAARPDWNDVTGIAQCRPRAWDGSRDPQAIFITGNDGTEFVIF